METLQLKDVAGYLPYGLQFKDTLSNSVGEWHSVDLKRYPETGIDTRATPLLLPLSCLIEEIDHKGKTIVPIVELAKLAGVEMRENRFKVRGSQWSACLVTYSDTPCTREWEYFEYDEGVFTRRIVIYEKETACENQHLLIDYLHELHIDYRNLIGRGLAKDKRVFNNK